VLGRHNLSKWVSFQSASTLYFIQPKLVASVKPDPNIEDWRAKFVEVINRAKNAYKGDSAALAEFEAIAKSTDTSVADDLKIKAKRNPLFVALLGGLVVLGIGGFVMNQADKAKAAQCDATYAQGSTTESARLQAIEAVANQEFSNQKYQEALVSAGKLMWSYEEPCKIDGATKPKAVWDEKRAQLTASIQSGMDAQAAAKKAEADLVTAQAQAEQQKVLDEAKVEQQKVQAKAIAVKKAADDKKW
ncbi:hypothetical protein HUU62_22990, partial [Rhodoferax sp. 4810]|nr:hypothetical protein [Rhodoferax jenense]